MTDESRPGKLAARVAARVDAALASGALQPIATEQVEIEEGGVRFLVRAVSSLARKQLDRRRRGAAGEASANPFQPWDPALFVADISASHVALLNKFPVIERHLLIVTRHFEEQETLLGRDDFAAVRRCLDEVNGLVFYNGGAEAGASQRHKHLQLLPLPLTAAAPALPVEPLLAAAAGVGDGIARLPGFGFQHAFRRLADPSPELLLSCYLELARAMGVAAMADGTGAYQSRPYNLLLTGRWMLLVPRRCEHWQGVSVNALGYAGSLFVPDTERLELLRRVGPLSVLRRVSLPVP